MNLFHLDHEGKSARISFRSLPFSELEGNLVEKTSIGLVDAVKVINGMNSNLELGQLQPDALIQADPELDLSMAGEILDPEALSTAYYDPASRSRSPVSNFTLVEVVIDPAGQEKERRPHRARRSNINELYPVKTGKRMPVAQALLQFVFKQCFQLVHEDGVTHDFLFQLARDLHQKQEMLLLGAGPKGNQPLIIRDKGSLYRGFLYGELPESGPKDQYKLLVLLSDQELKRPPRADASATAL